MSKMNDAELHRRLEMLAGVQPSPEATARAMDRVRQMILTNERQQARKSLGRILMNSKWSKSAVAAVVALAVIAGLSMFTGDGSRQGLCPCGGPVARREYVDLQPGHDDRPAGDADGADGRRVPVAEPNPHRHGRRLRHGGTAHAGRDGRDQHRSGDEELRQDQGGQSAGGPVRRSMGDDGETPGPARPGRRDAGPQSRSMDGRSTDSACARTTP